MKRRRKAGRYDMEDLLVVMKLEALASIRAKRSCETCRFCHKETLTVYDFTIYVCQWKSRAKSFPPWIKDANRATSCPYEGCPVWALDSSNKEVTT